MQADARAEIARVLVEIDPELRVDRAAARARRRVTAAAVPPSKFHGEDCRAMLENYGEVEAHFRRARDPADATADSAPACLYRMLTSREVERFDDCIPGAESAR